MKKHILCNMFALAFSVTLGAYDGTNRAFGRITPSPSPQEAPPQRETPQSHASSTTPTPRQTPQPFDAHSEEGIESSQGRAATVPLISMRRNNTMPTAIRPVAISPTASTSPEMLGPVQRTQRMITIMQRRFQYFRHTDQELSREDIEAIRHHRTDINTAHTLLQNSTAQQIGYGSNSNRRQRQLFFHTRFINWLKQQLDAALEDQGASS